MAAIAIELHSVAYIPRYSVDAVAGRLLLADIEHAFHPTIVLFSSTTASQQRTLNASKSQPDPQDRSK